jgi:2-polyprenyl-3-methyl-5-hydroxy-6-metoxy-1,4-benzoquinol methylase
MEFRLKRHYLGYWELEEKPNSDFLRSYYADKYYQGATGSYELSYDPEEIDFFRAKLEQRWHIIQKIFAGKTANVSARMLDVGCGEGYALEFFRAKGWKAKGIDFSSSGVESKNPACLEMLVVGDVFELLRLEITSGEKYRVVWLQNVLEHVLDPIALLCSMRKLVDKDGLAVVTVPNDCSIVQMAALKNGHIDTAFWVTPPDHLSYFSVDSLKSIASATGWDCPVISGDFPVDWLLFHPDANYVRDKSKGKVAHRTRVQLENLLHTGPIELVTEFWEAAGRLGVGRNITAFLTPA